MYISRIRIRDIMNLFHDINSIYDIMNWIRDMYMSRILD